MILRRISLEMDVNDNDPSKKPTWLTVLKKVINMLKNRNTKLSHRRVRAIIKKEKRKLKRQLFARDRESSKLPDTQSVDSDVEDAEQKIIDEYAERERKRLHYLWLKREEQAKIDFIRNQEMKEKDRLHREEEIKRNLEELKKLEENEENAEDGTKAVDKEEVCRDLISKLPDAPQDGEPWHNPIAPQNYVPGIVKERETCMFFAKTGACRFGDRCSRWHDRPTCSSTILVHNMFSHFGLDQALRDEYDTDLTLEYEDSDTYQHFRDFYDDVLPEFKKLGKVIQFKVCCNHEPHLRGNVYVQYSSDEEASGALCAFNGRWYASRQLTCEFCPVTQWKKAICGLFHTKRCPKGRTCNFLHVFRNPTNEFWTADRGISENNSNNNISVMTKNTRRFAKDHSSRRSRRRDHSPSYSERSSSRSKSRRSRSRSPKFSSRHWRRDSRDHTRQEKHLKRRERKRHRSRSSSPVRDSLTKSQGLGSPSQKVSSSSPDSKRRIKEDSHDSSRTDSKRRKHKKHRKKHRKRRSSRGSSYSSSTESWHSPSPKPESANINSVVLPNPDAENTQTEPDV